MRRITILGSTGCVGRQALNILNRLPPKSFQVVALTGHRNLQVMIQQCRRFLPCHAVVASLGEARILKAALKQFPISVSYGEKALEEIASIKVDWTLAAISGFDGVPATLAAAKAARVLALANKETVVCAGKLLQKIAAASETSIIPVDSEHHALFRLLNGLNTPSPFHTLTLTASGGPFRDLPKHKMKQITPEQAVNHPTWSMGKKISLDSATLVNKGMEIIEASVLFNTPPHTIEVVLHPQCIVHALVTKQDGTIIAFLSPPSMEVSLAYAWQWPEERDILSPILSLTQMQHLTFDALDEEVFSAVSIAREAAALGQAACCAFNAANEVVAEAFFQRKISFLDIIPLIHSVMECFSKTRQQSTMRDFKDISEVNQQTRKLTLQTLQQRPQYEALS